MSELSAKLEEVLALSELATPGQWEFREIVAGDSEAHEVGVAGDKYQSICDDERYYPQAVSIEDMRLIASAVNLLRDHGPALRALLAEHEALLRRVEGAEVADIRNDGQNCGESALLAAAKRAGYYNGAPVRIVPEPREE